VTAVSGLESAGWLHGLKLAAVVVVAQAVWGMGQIAEASKRRRRRRRPAPRQVPAQ
jgi:chromate transport protein ChrA